MRNKIIALCFALLLAAPLFSQTRSRLTKIGFISSAQIYDSVINDITLLSIIDKAFIDNQTKISAMAGDIAKLKEIIANPNTSESAKKDAEKNLTVKEAEYNKLISQLTSQLGRREDVIKIEINKHIASAIYTITRREGYTAIIEKDKSVLFVDKEFDITTLILAYVRESIKKMEVK